MECFGTNSGYPYEAGDTYSFYLLYVCKNNLNHLAPNCTVSSLEFQLAPMRLGLLFLVTSFSYAISSPFWGWLVGRYDHENLMMIVGLSATAISLLLLGPSPVLPELPK